MNWWSLHICKECHAYWYSSLSIRPAQSHKTATSFPYCLEENLIISAGKHVSNLIEMNMTNKACIDFKITNMRRVFSIPARITSPHNAQIPRKFSLCTEQLQLISNFYDKNSKQVKRKRKTHTQTYKTRELAAQPMFPPTTAKNLLVRINPIA